MGHAPRPPQNWKFAIQNKLFTLSTTLIGKCILFQCHHEAGGGGSIGFPTLPPLRSYATGSALGGGGAAFT